MISKEDRNKIQEYAEDAIGQVKDGVDFIEFVVGLRKLLNSLTAQEGEDYTPNGDDLRDIVVDTLREPYDGHDFASLPTPLTAEDEEVKDD